MSTSDREAVKKMAELLKLGAIMLPQKCPVKGCNLPLFKLRSGEIVCPIHGRVYLVRSDEEAREVASRATLLGVLERLEKKIIETLNEITGNLVETSYRDIIGWLEALERVIRIKREALAAGKEGE